MRRLSLVILSALAVMAFGAPSAQAGYEVRDYETEEPCPELQVSGNTVTGGCFVEHFSGPWQVWSGQWLVASCESSFNMRIDSVGKFYGVSTYNSCKGLWRKACEDESTGERIPWPGLLSGPYGPPAMSICVESGDGGGGHIPLYIEFELDLWENGELLHMIGTDENSTVKNAEFTNYNPEAILITTTP